MLLGEEFDEILITVKELVAAKKSPCLLEQILLEYLQLKGRKIPFKKFGYINELELLQQRGAEDLFTIKDRRGKLYIKLKKADEIMSSKAKRSTAIVTTIPMIKSSVNIKQEGKKKEKNLNTSRSETSTKISNLQKLDVNISEFNEKEQQQKRGDKKMTTMSNHKINSINQTKAKKITIKTRNSKSDNYSRDVVEKINDDNVIGSTPLTQVKSLSQCFHTKLGNKNEEQETKLNFLDWHLINILHTKVMAHPKGFYAHQLPDWYQRTFDRHIEDNWFDLINKSNQFVQKKDDDDKILLFVLSDLDIETIIKTTNSKPFDEYYDE